MDDDIYNNVEEPFEDSIEETTGEEEVKITKPFDPSKIKITTKPEVLQNIIERLEYNEINIFTDFQRKNDLWDEIKQSRLIESILLKLPLPAFYFDGSDDNKWDVVDGLQRISTIKNFVVDKTLKLSNLEFLKELEGLGYDDLSRTLKRRIKGFQIIVYIIEPSTPDDVKYNIFKRINTGGLILEAQEIRHALNQGKPATFIKELSELEVFKKATDYKLRSDRMKDREFVNRFVAYYVIGYKEYEPDLDSFLNKGMAMVDQLDDSELHELKSHFEASMELAYTIFGNDAFRKRENEKDRRKPINKALFDCLSVSFAKLSNLDRSSLSSRAEEFRYRLMQETKHENRIFYDAISHGTSAKESVVTRFKIIDKLIESTLSNANSDKTN